MTDPKELLDALKAIYAVLNQNKTFPADVAYAKRIAEYTISKSDPDLIFIRELETRSMSTWTDEELQKYSELTGQSE